MNEFPLSVKIIEKCTLFYTISQWHNATAGVSPWHLLNVPLLLGKIDTVFFMYRMRANRVDWFSLKNVERILQLNLHFTRSANSGNVGRFWKICLI